MPSSVRLSRSAIITATRVKEPPDATWIDLYKTADNGASWHILSRPARSAGGHSGNPPSMIRLRDGRICLTYGYRDKPYGIRALLSSDEGKSWSPEIKLRTDGGAWDLGYTRTVERPDGKIVTVYYFTGSPTSERYIGATIWNPGAK